MLDINLLKLPTISEAGQQALELLSDDLIEMAYLADFLGKDPAIAANLLKYANSPVYRRQVEVKSVRNAVTLLGLKTCKMAVGVTILQTYMSEPNAITEMVWAHSTSVATVARLIAEKTYPALVDDIETTALMHDMGILVMVSSFSDSYLPMVEKCIAERTPLATNELENYNFTHDDVFEHLAKKLRIPQSTSQCIKQFHSPEPLIDISQEEHIHLAVCHLAHQLVYEYNDRNGTASHGIQEQLANDLDNLTPLLNISENMLDDLVEDAEMMLNIL